MSDRLYAGASWPFTVEFDLPDGFATVESTTINLIIKRDSRLDDTNAMVEESWDLTDLGNLSGNTVTANCTVGMDKTAEVLPGENMFEFYWATGDHEFIIGDPYREKVYDRVKDLPATP